MRNSGIDLNRRARMTGRRRAVCLAVLLVGSAPVAATDDDYLRLLDEEVSKVDGAAGVADVAAPGNVDGAGGRAPGTRQQFEDTLRDQHVGTYSFYRRLPERSRQEIFLDFQAGMPMDQLRDKVVERFLHP